MEWDKTIDLDGYEDSGAAQVYPGTYVLKIVKAVYEEAGSGNERQHDAIILTLRSATGKFSGSIRDTISMSPEARFKPVSLVKAIEGLQSIEASEIKLSRSYLEGAVVAARVSPNAWNNKVYFRPGAYFSAAGITTDQEGDGDLPAGFDAETLLA